MKLIHKKLQCTEAWCYCTARGQKENMAVILWKKISCKYLLPQLLKFRERWQHDSERKILKQFWSKEGYEKQF